jgi:hypothetical protein
MRRIDAEVQLAKRRTIAAASLFQVVETAGTMQSVNDR